MLREKTIDGRPGAGKSENGQIGCFRPEGAGAAPPQERLLAAIPNVEAALSKERRYRRSGVIAGVTFSYEPLSVRLLPQPGDSPTYSYDVALSPVSFPAASNNPN
jgi:hypothetical protein